MLGGIGVEVHVVSVSAGKPHVGEGQQSEEKPCQGSEEKPWRGIRGGGANRPEHVERSEALLVGGAVELKRGGDIPLLHKLDLGGHGALRPLGLVRKLMHQRARHFLFTRRPCGTPPPPNTSTDPEGGNLVLA